MAYDSHRHRAVLFGGSTGTGTFLNDTWEWDGVAWVQVSTVGPSARSNHAMVYDSVRQRTVLFGGVFVLPGLAFFLQDTWEWDGATWTQCSNGPAREGHAMAFDSLRGRTVLFGGHVGSAVFSGETWEWDGASWIPVASTGPAARAAHAMVYDSSRHRTVMFAGYSTGSIYVEYGDTWEWDGQTWTLAASSGPAPRTEHEMAYVSHTNRTVLHGGYSGGGPLPETWEWNGSAWTQAAGATPSSNFSHAMVYDDAHGLVLLFGGYAGTTGFFVPTAETWVRPCGPIVGLAATATPYGSGCGTPLPSFAPVVGSRPLLGQTQRCHIDNASFGFAAVAWGLTNQSLALDFIGINGCTLLNGAEIEVGSFCASTSFTTARHSLAIPFDATIIGVHVFLQAWTLAAGFNPVGVKMSNGVELVIGDT
ncbi:MAG: hypothetical protein JNK78_03380 [Planctomycetes bacterium]|nr:hypothetical protein [Planctomycetota bacterium]